ncbi:hypothetical protein SAMN05216299_10571 [Nitrosospira sp. Nsp14]|nr:hypothetical protein SAMN05216299_10571 [Nitrosospira sp. Nsp14]
MGLTFTSPAIYPVLYPVLKFRIGVDPFSLTVMDLIPRRFLWFAGAY